MSQYYKFEYETMMKLDLVYKQPFSFSKFLPFPPSGPLFLTPSFAYLVLPNVPAPRLLEPPCLSDLRVIALIYCTDNNSMRNLKFEYAKYEH